MPKVSEAHRAARRRQILDGARRAFAARGYFETNVHMLEAEIGLSRGAIFSYFPTKLDLFTTLAEEDRDRLGTIWLEQGYEAVVRHVGEEDPDWIGVYLEVSRMLRTDAALRAHWATMSSEVQDRLVARYVELQNAGEIRSDVPIETVLRFLGVVFDGLVSQQGAGFPIDIEGTLLLVRSALSPS
ncbi:MAG TPA: TetR/AcrR family transcriptional regulator [Gaiellaceae bacterium]|nr:TetR/AcrR family transcriptional regulator [Gaiellaceae bacterium]